MSGRERRVELDCLLERSDGFLQEARIAARPVVPALEIGVVGLEIVSPPLDERPARRTGQRHLEPIGDRARDVVLNREDVIELPVVPLGPQMIAVGGVHELHADPNAVAGLAHASLEHGRDVEARGNFAHIHLLALELK